MTRFIKKNAAFFMAVVMLLQLIQGYFTIALAAAGDLSVELDMRLRTSIAYYELERATSPSNNEMLMVLDVRDSGEYVLKTTIEVGGSTTSTGQAWNVYIFAAKLPGSTELSLAYAFKDPTKDYVKQKPFIDRLNGIHQTFDNYYADTINTTTVNGVEIPGTRVPAMDMAKTEIPSFTVPQNTGLSTSFGRDPNDQIKNVTLNFLYQGNSLFVSLNNYTHHIIYDYETYYTEVSSEGKPSMLERLKLAMASAPSERIKKYAYYNGIDTQNIEPFAYVNDLKEKGLTSDIINQTTDTPDENPATDPNGIVITFQMPKRMIGTEFQTIDNNTAARVIVDLRDKAGVLKPYEITINDIFSNGSTSGNLVCYGDDYKGDVIKAEYDEVNHKLYIIGIPAATIFDATIHTVFTSEVGGYKLPQVARPVVKDNYEAYTFIPYEIEYRNGYYYVKILQQYMLSNGQYLATVNTNYSGLTGSPDRVVVNGDGQTNPLYIPIYNYSPTNSVQSPRYFKVYFSPGQDFDRDQATGGIVYNDRYIESQMIHFRPSANLPVISPPEDFTVDETMTELAKSDRLYGAQSDLELKLGWNIGGIADIKEWLKRNNNQSTLYYNVYGTLSPIEINPEYRFDTVALTLTLNANNTIDAHYKGYASDTFVVESTQRNIGQLLSDSRNDMLKASVTLKMRAENISVNNDYAPRPGEGIYFYYPAIYFLKVANINAVDDPLDPDVTKAMESNYTSITLNQPDSTSIATAQSLRARDPVTTTKDDYDVNTGAIALKNETSFVAEWDIPARSLHSFLEDNYTYFDPLILTYTLYLSQDGNIGERLKSANNEDIIKNVDSRYTFTYSQAISGNSANDKTIYFSEINSGTNNLSAISNQDILAALRNGEIVAIVDIPLEVNLRTYFRYLIQGTVPPPVSLKLDGLDKNQQYYIMVNAYLGFNASFVDNNGVQTTLFLEEISDVSNIAAILTKPDLEVPNPNETTPGMPTPIWDAELAKSTILDIHWKKIPTLYNDFGVPISYNEYEIIRLTNTQMPDSLKNMKNMAVEQFLASTNFNNEIDPSTEKMVLRTDIRGNNVPWQLNGSQWTPSVGIDCAETVTDVRLTDNTLTPNTIYFYYVRTVQITTDGIRTYSPWAGVSATTKTVESPENLTIVRLDVSYDPKTEMIIAFDAPVGSLVKLGTDYNLQYSIKRNDEDWQEPVTMNTALLRQSAVEIADNPGYYRFTYKISGLVPSSLYNVRVRMIDQNGDASMYSLPAQTRTDFNQEDYDTDKEQSDWERFVKEQLAALFKNPVWYTADSSTELTVVYRPSAIDDLIKSTVGSQLNLISPTVSQRAEYYFPGAVIEKLNASGKALTVTCGDLQIIFSKNSIDVTYNETIVSVKSSISNRKLSDYTIRIAVTQTPGNERIDGNQIVGNQIDISVDCIGLTKTAEQWDTETLNMYLTQIAGDTFTNSSQSELKRMIDTNAAYTEMARYVDTLVANARKSLMSDTNASLVKILSGVNTVKKLDSQIIIKTKLPVSNATLKGFTARSGQWEPVPVSDYSGGKAILATAPGSYVFTGYTSNLPGVESVSGNEALSGIIAKYALDDYLGRGAAFSLSNKATVNTVSGIVARLAGADAAADPAVFLKSKGYTIPQRSSQNATTQETIYMFMALYEMKTGVKIDTMRIKNYSATAGISGIDDKNLKSIQAAYETGIFTNTKMSANDTLTTQDILDIISAFNKKVKL